MSNDLDQKIQNLTSLDSAHLEGLVFHLSKWLEDPVTKYLFKLGQEESEAYSSMMDLPKSLDDMIHISSTIAYQKGIRFLLDKIPFIKEDIESEIINQRME